MCQIWYDYINKQKSCGPNTKPYQIPYTVDLEVKGQHHIRIINATHSLMVIDPYGKYGKPILKQKKLQAGRKDMSKKKLWADTNLHR